MPDLITVEQLQSALPKGMKKQINPLLVMGINNALSNPEEYKLYSDNLLNYASVLQQGKFKLQQYLNAVKYVSFKMMDCTNKEAYKKTFPDKYKRFVDKGVAEKDIASYTTAYNKSKLVNLIFEQTLIPTHILNAPLLQKAINTQAEIMIDPDVSPKVRSDAANSLMTHLKPPETKKLELDIGINRGSVIDDYEKVMAKMVHAQQDLIRQGGNIKQIANASIKKDEDIVDGEIVDEYTS